MCRHGLRWYDRMCILGVFVIFWFGDHTNYALVLNATAGLLFSCLLPIHHATLLSPGLWDEMSSRDVCKIVSEELNRTRSLGRVGEQLCVESYTRGSQDNITALVIDVPVL